MQLVKKEKKMKKPIIRRENVETLLDKKFVKVYDLQYAEGKHYLNASRRDIDDLVAIKSEEDFKKMLPDAVSCFVIIRTKNDRPRLLLTYEYRYPAGQFLLSVPAGLIDAADVKSDNPITTTAKREIKEETGIDVKDTDRVYTVDQFVFSTPGMTDESNALACAVIELDDLSSLNQDGAEGSECFDGFVLLDRDEAKKLLDDGRDEHGNFYSIYTWAALMYFISGLWEE